MARYYKLFPPHRTSLLPSVFTDPVPEASHTQQLEGLRPHRQLNVCGGGKQYKAADRCLWHLHKVMGCLCDQVPII